MRIRILSLLFLFSFEVKSQQIFYEFPKSVNDEIYSYLSKQRTPQDDDLQWAIKLSVLDSNRFLISIFESKKDSSDLVYKVLIKNSNRYVKVNSYKLPLITSEDLTFTDFGTVEYPSEVTGKRRIGKKKVMMTIDSYNLTFDKRGKIYE